MLELVGDERHLTLSTHQSVSPNVEMRRHRPEEVAGTGDVDRGSQDTGTWEIVKSELGVEFSSKKCFCFKVAVYVNRQLSKGTRVANEPGDRQVINPTAKHKGKLG